MARLKPVSHHEFARRLQKLGFQGPYPGSKHPFFIRKGRPYHVPNPHGHEISVGLLKRVLSQLDISREEWESVT